MDSFAKFFGQQQHRHRGSGFTDVHKTYRRKHQNLVPDTFKKDLSKNGKIEKLKQMSGTCPCDSADLDYIKKTFNIVPHKAKQQLLGKTGITLSFNPKTQTFMLTK